MSSNVVVRFRDLGWKRVVQTASALGSVAVKVGVLGIDGQAPARRRDGSLSKLTLAQVATVNEFGSSDDHTPERSFLRSTFNENRGEVASALADGVRRAVFGAAPVMIALAGIGEWAVTRVRAKIQSGVAPANRPATVALKGSDRTLIDTHDLLDAIKSEVTVDPTGGLDSAYESLDVESVVTPGSGGGD